MIRIRFYVRGYSPKSRRKIRALGPKGGEYLWQENLQEKVEVGTVILRVMLLPVERVVFQAGSADKVVTRTKLLCKVENRRHTMIFRHHGVFFLG